MKIHRFPLLIVLFLLGSLLLSGCGGVLVNNWPGLSANQDTVYLSYQGAVYAVNSTNGSVAWSFPAEADPSKPFYAAPAFGEDGLIVVGNYGSTLYAIDSNGAKRWEYVIESGNFVASPLVVNDTIIAPTSDEALYALDSSGNLLWTFQSPNMLWAQPAADNQVVFVPALDHHLYALNLADGSEIWSVDLGSALLSSPVQDEENNLYITTMEGELISLNPDNGSINWRTSTGGRVWSSPVLNEGVLYVGNMANTVSAISAEDGALLWQKEASGPVIGGGALIPDGVAFPTETGSLIAFDFDGNKLWEQPVNGKLYTTPVIAGETLVVAVTEGDTQLQAFRLNGQPAWPFTLPR